MTVKRFKVSELDALPADLAGRLRAALLPESTAELASVDIDVYRQVRDALRARSTPVAAPASPVRATLTGCPANRPHRPVPREQWPGWAMNVAGRRREGEVGVGDTARRLFTSVGGEHYKSLRKAFGLPCRCVERQQEWNEWFPYN